MKRTGKNGKTNWKLVLNIVPAFFILLIFFFVFAREEIVELSTESFVLKSQNYSDRISDWAGKIINELSIYKDYSDIKGIDSEETFKFFETSCGKFDSFPYGLYWGDVKGNYFDASGWVPPEDYVNTKRNWYVEGLGHDVFTIGEPYVDVMTGDACVSVTVRTGTGENESVLATDVYLDYASSLVTQIAKEGVETAFIASVAENKVLACSDVSMTGKFLDDRGNPLLYRNIGSLLKEGGRDGLSTVRGDDGVFYVNVCDIEGVNWYFVSTMKRKDVLADLYKTELAMLVVTIIVATNLILALKRIVDRLSTVDKKAKTDPLTRILNRNGFEEMVAINREAHPGQGVLLIIDRDIFKLVNDRLGHPEGDEVLKKFAALLEDYFNRNKDIVARIGGDEFAVFAGRAITEDETKVMLEKFIQVFHAAFDEQYFEMELSVSIGGTFDKGSLAYEELYKKADAALYQIKQGGKNNFKICP